MAKIGTFPIKILAQVGESDPIEIGTYDVPINIGAATPAHNHGVVSVNCREVAGDMEALASDLRTRRTIAVSSAL